jgi:hypothetical protein
METHCINLYCSKEEEEQQRKESKAGRKHGSRSAISRQKHPLFALARIEDPRTKAIIIDTLLRSSIESAAFIINDAFWVAASDISYHLLFG